MATYFVKNGGNDGSDGLSDANAWATIGKVNGFTFSAGDTIQFKRGSTFDDIELKPGQSGSSGSPITFQDYDSGNKPKFLGSDDVLGVTGDWTQDGGANRWSRTFIPDSDNAIDNGLAFFDGTATKNQESVKNDVDAAGEWFYDAVGNLLYVYATSNPATFYTSIRVASRIFTLDCNAVDWLDFKNLVFREAERGINLNGSDNLNFTEVESSHSGGDPCWKILGSSTTITLTNCAGYSANVNLPVVQNAHGMIIIGTASGIIVDGMPAISPNNGNDWGNNGSDGFQVNTNGAGLTLTTKKVISKDNTENGIDVKDGIVILEDGTLKAGTVQSPGAVKTQADAESMTLTRMRLESTDGVNQPVLAHKSGALISTQTKYLGGDVSNITVTFKESATAASFENDIFTNHSSGSNKLFEINNDVSFEVKVDHCTFYADVNTRIVQVRGTATGPSIDINNSILVNNGTQEVMEQDVTGGTNEIKGDNLVLFKESGTNYVDWTGTNYNATEVTDGTLQAAEGVGDNWITASDPLFVDKANDNFDVTAASPALRAASSGSTTTIDHNGRLRPATATDRAIGAFETPILEFLQPLRGLEFVATGAVNDPRLYFRLKAVAPTLGGSALLLGL